MAINYYNTVEDNRSVEKPFSITQKLDQWGTKLVDPRQVFYGGRNFSVTNKGVEDKGVVTTGKLELTRFDRIKVRVGIILKQIAAFFNPAIKIKYKMVDAYVAAVLNPSSEKTPVSSSAEKVQAVRQGQDCGDACFAACCPCIR